MDPDDPRDRMAQIIASQQEQTGDPALAAAQANTAAQAGAPPAQNYGWRGRMRPGMGMGPRGMFGGAPGPAMMPGGADMDPATRQRILDTQAQARGGVFGGMQPDGPNPQGNYMGAKQQAQGMGPPQPGGGMPMGSKGSAADMSGGQTPAGGMFGGGGGMTPPPASGSNFTGGKGGPVQSFAGGM